MSRSICKNASADDLTEEEIKIIEGEIYDKK